MIGVSAAADDDQSILLSDAWERLWDDCQSAENWEQIHAAEVMIFLGESDRAREEMLTKREERERGASRIGVWRVLARTAPDPVDRQRWVDKIGAVFLDKSAPDRLQAVETLAKLKEAGTAEIREEARPWLDSDNSTEFFVAVWFLAEANDQGAIERVWGMLDANEANTRRQGAYVVSRLGAMRPDRLRKLTEVADAEPDDSIATPYLLAAALNLKADPRRTDVWVARLQRVEETATAGAQLESARALRHEVTVTDAAGWETRLNASAVDARLSAAWVILHTHLRDS